ncbi:hypothetical protein F5884DRAFT_805396 [Xylogone sp. PMI_703]|nr:hypothetical protein F5884DRAFT_805396 [Xylogone sp. PMI_703]
MCFFDLFQYKCGDRTWGHFRQHCHKEYRTGEVCGMKLVMDTIPHAGKCRTCEKIETKYNRMRNEQELIKRWKKEGSSRKASIAASEDTINHLEQEIRELEWKREDMKLSLPGDAHASSTHFSHIIYKKDFTHQLPVLATSNPFIPDCIEPQQQNIMNVVCERDLENAISSRDFAKTRQLLEEFFVQVAVDEYSWLVELRQLGYSPREIADILLEKSLYGPWIFGMFESPIVRPFEENFHLSQCAHNTKVTGGANISAEYDEAEFDPSTSTEDGNFKFPIRETIEYFCGLGGARPAANKLNQIELGSVDFGDENTTATVSFSGPESPLPNNQDKAPEVWNRILQNLEFAAGVLQRVGGCCDSFTFLSRHKSYIEMQKVELVKLRRFHELLKEVTATYNGTLSRWEQLWSQLSFIGLEGVLVDYPQPFDSSFAIDVCSLAVQFLSLAMLSYAQAHCGPVRPFFLDTSQERVTLLGSGKTGSHLGKPCVVGSLVELTCMGNMIGRPVFAFEYFPKYEEGIVKEKPREKFDLLACPEDLLDTWGPGELIADVKDPQRLFVIFIRGGVITPIKKADQTVLHWSREPLPSNSFTTWFDRRSKIPIGALMVENPLCQANIQAQMRTAEVLLEELGTFPSYWEVSERQVGFGVQGGQSGVASFQFNQTWVKMPGHTKKSKMLARQVMYTADLEGPFGVQVSLCTGIARRVRLRELLADILPAYIAALVAKPPLWKSLDENFHILDALKGSNLKDWLVTLDHDHQRTFENLVFAILFLLQDTGVDPKGENFFIACIQPDSPSHCFKVPCKKESYWARMLADSEEIATFAYITTKCLETTQVKCRGPTAAWANSTGLLWTSVSCYQDRVAAATSSAPSPQWALKDSEAYLLGKPDAPLFVRVYRPNRSEEPHLLVSLSTIPREYLYRIYSKGKPRRLSERKAIDQFAESVIVLVGQHGKP